jgi:Leucine-rich repeat (LRR) protein
LADNDLTELSERVGELRTLDLDHNRLRRIPESVGEAHRLYLYLHDNALTELPASLGRLTRLRYLNISGNQFDVFPEAVTNMSEKY